MDTIISIFYKLTLSNIDIKLLDKDDPYYLFCKKSSNSISSEDLQLYYQIAISSKKDFRQAPSKKDHFIMIILRMIHFTDNKTSLESDFKKKEQSVENDDSKLNNSAEKSHQDKNNTSNDKWANAVLDMSLSGLTLHLAMQSVMTNVETNSPTLFINEDKKDIYPKLCIEDLLLKIKEYFNIDFDITIEYSKDLLTPIILESLKSENEVNDRFDKVKDNPDINKLQKVFGANINKESIKKIIE